MKKPPLAVWFLVYLAAMYGFVAYVLPFGLPHVIPYLPALLKAVWGGDVPPNILPASVFAVYMAMVTIAGVVYMMSDEARWKGFYGPVLDLLTPAAGESTARRGGRTLLLCALPLLAGYVAYGKLDKKATPPAEIRKVHPSPPESVSVHGKDYKLQGLSNPFRVSDPEQLQKNTQEGKKVYYQNCFYCHGDAMDGKGLFAKGVNPPPADFVDPGTITMLTEAFVFWRVSKGGPGMPEDSNTSWNSAMPVWETMLTDEEIWKAILWIYAGSGRKPRTWDNEEKK